MKIVFIGAGNLATNLSVALQKTGNEIAQVYSRTEESATMLASRLGCEWTISMKELKNDADLYIVSLADYAVPSLVDEMKEGREDRLFVHTAGTLPMDILKTERRGVFYPMQTFSKTRIVELTDFPMFIEASNEEDAAMLEQLARSLSQNVFHLNSADRQYLHLAAVFCSNFVNHCYALCDEILKEHNVPFSVMLPLIDEVASKIHTLSPKDAQTGPAIRHDENVMAKHMSLLQNNPRLQSIYDIMSKSIAYDKL